MIRNKNIAKKEYFSKNMSEAEIERHFARLKYSSASVIPELVKNAPIFFEGIPLNSKHTFSTYLAPPFPPHSLDHALLTLCPLALPFALIPHINPLFRTCT